MRIRQLPRCTASTTARWCGWPPSWCATSPPPWGSAEAQSRVIRPGPSRPCGPCWRWRHEKGRGGPGGRKRPGASRMTPVNGDIDQILRRALHAEVDSIEPADGGLERIRRRTHAPWLVRQASLMLTECIDLARLIRIRLEPAVTGLRTNIAERGGPWAAFVGLLSSTVASIVALFTPSRRPSRHHHHRSPRSGSNLGRLRPALAAA